jgi:hypothetical protein
LIWVVGSYNLLPLVDLLFHLRIRDPHRRGLCRVVCYTRACAAVRMYGLIVFQVFIVLGLIKVCGRPLCLDSCC